MVLLPHLFALFSVQIFHLSSSQSPSEWELMLRQKIFASKFSLGKKTMVFCHSEAGNYRAIYCDNTKGEDFMSQQKISANRLDRGFFRYQTEFEAKALAVLRSGWYVLGKEVAAFEDEFATYLGARCCAGVASGLDALWLAFRVLGIGRGDEVIVQGNTYIASVMGITINGATPIFVEPDANFNIATDKIE